MSSLFLSVPQLSRPSDRRVDTGVAEMNACVHSTQMLFITLLCCCVTNKPSLRTAAMIFFYIYIFNVKEESDDGFLATATGSYK